MKCDEKPNSQRTTSITVTIDRSGLPNSPHQIISANNAKKSTEKLTIQCSIDFPEIRNWLEIKLSTVEKTLRKDGKAYTLFFKRL